MRHGLAMSMSPPIVLQLQADASDQSASASSLLRKAKTLSFRLDLKDISEWIENELTGYDASDDIPSYRLLHGEPKFWNPYRGWIPTHIDDENLYRVFSQTHVLQPIGGIEETVRRSQKSGFVVGHYSPHLKSTLMKLVDSSLEPSLILGLPQVWSITEAVRNFVHDWSLKLEKAGILGEGLRFTESERREASIVTNQIYAQNVGVVGNVSDSAKVHNQQVGISAPLDLSKVREIVVQAQRAIELLPPEQQASIKPAVEELDAELASNVPSQPRIRSLLQSLRTACEGATGNLVAEGVLALLAKLPVLPG